MFGVRFTHDLDKREVGLLLMEELSANDAFCDWFVSNAYQQDSYLSRVGVWHIVSKTKPCSFEVAFVFLSQSGRRSAILIGYYDKNPRQFEFCQSWSQQGEQGINDGYWEQFSTCLIVPAIGTAKKIFDASFDTVLEYQQLLEQIKHTSPDDSRTKFKTDFLDAARMRTHAKYFRES